jgi:hypothetical protein
MREEFLMPIFKKKSNSGDNAANLNKASELESAVASNVSETDDKELVAVIMAAVMNCMNAASSSLRIRSIKRVGRNSPVWNTAGRDEYIASKL